MISAVSRVMICDTIYWSTVIVLTHGGSSTVHIYTHKCGPCPVFVSFILAFSLQLRKKARENLSQGSQRGPVYILPKRTHTHTHTLQTALSNSFFLPCSDIFKLWSTYLLKIIHSLSADANSSTASSRLNWHPRRFKWTRPFRWKTKSCFCACAITFRTSCTHLKTESSVVLSPVRPALTRDWAL